MFSVHFCALDRFNGNLLRHGVGAGLKSAPSRRKPLKAERCRREDRNPQHTPSPLLY